jgi:UDP-glucose 6-dehydrogenase
LARSSIKRVSVVGLGKLGLTLAAVLADSGFEVTGIELDESKVEAVNKGRSPLYEPGLDDLVRKNHRRLKASSDYDGRIADTDVTFVVVPTPSLESGAFSTDLVEKAMKSIGRELAGKKGYHLVVLTSTVGPGSMDGVVKPALEKTSGRKVGATLGLCYNPEFIALGDVIRGLRSPDFILIGESDKKAGDILASIQNVVCTNSPPIERMEFINAELAKIAVNSFVTMKMSFANTLAEITEKLPGGNVDKVTTAIGRDKRIGGAYLRGATGFGGTCAIQGTMIQTKDGLRPIQSIGVGEEVLAHDGEFHRVSETFSRDYDGPVITIKPGGGIPVTVTPEHPVFSAPRVLDERLRYLDFPTRKGNDGYFRNGHRLRSMSLLQQLPYTWRLATELRHGDLMAYPIPKFPKKKVPVLDFRAYHKRIKRSKLPGQLLLTPDIARLIGYYLSEGSTWKKQITFSLHRDEIGVIEDLKALVRSLNYTPRLKRRASGNGADLVFICAPLARFLRATFGHKAASKRLPHGWLGLDKSLLVELLKGIMYGDGSPSDSQYTLGITSRELANQMYLMLLSLGIAASYRLHPRYVGKDGVFHKDSFFVTVRHSREIQKLTALLPMMPISEGKTTETKTMWIDGGALNRHVRTLSKSRYRGTVYNLEVEGANSYCSEGAILHNCFPRDNIAFARYAANVGAQALIAEATNKVNLSQPGRLVALLKKKGLKRDTEVGILGLSFKPNTNIIEKSQALMLVQNLVEEGYRVTVYDPAALESARMVLKDSVAYAKSAEELVRGAGLVLLATPWPQFATIPARLFAGKAVFDCWRFLGEDVKKVSRYSSIGTP